MKSTPHKTGPNTDSNDTMHNQIIVNLTLLIYPPIKDFGICSNSCYTYARIHAKNHVSFL